MVLTTPGTSTSRSFLRRAERAVRLRGARRGAVARCRTARQDATPSQRSPRRPGTVTGGSDVGERSPERPVGRVLELGGDPAAVDELLVQLGQVAEGHAHVDVVGQVVA